METQGNKPVVFDEDLRLRVISKENFDDVTEMNAKSIGFVDKLQQFVSIVQSTTTSVQEQADIIRKAKLKAMGLRNLVEAEKESRKRKLMVLDQLINEKQTELERNNSEYESLFKVEAEQKLLTDKLSNTESV